MTKIWIDVDFSGHDELIVDPMEFHKAVIRYLNGDLDPLRVIALRILEPSIPFLKFTIQGPDGTSYQV